MVLSDDVKDEIDAIDAIYPDLLTKVNDDRIKIKVPQHENFTLQISFPSDYPSSEPPHLVEVSTSTKISNLYDKKYLLHLFSEVLDSVFHPGQVCIFDFLTELDGVLYAEDDADLGADTAGDEISDGIENLKIDPFEGWIASDPITDRKSTFIAFATKADSEEEAFTKLDLLRTDNKIARANHLMIAWRIKGENGVSFQDCDDDGETAAGGRMLHLLTVMDAWNVIVAVGRWFGGVHIGPDRFKHINSTTREVIVRGNFATPATGGGFTNNSSKKKK
ncbi:RWD domain-containing protein [Kluyveromyces marxianus]